MEAATHMNHASVRRVLAGLGLIQARISPV